MYNCTQSQTGLVTNSHWTVETLEKSAMCSHFFVCRSGELITASVLDGGCTPAAAVCVNNNMLPSSTNKRTRTTSFRWMTPLPPLPFARRLPFQYPEIVQPPPLFITVPQCRLGCETKVEPVVPVPVGDAAANGQLTCFHIRNWPLDQQNGELGANIYSWMENSRRQSIHLSSNRAELKIL